LTVIPVFNSVAGVPVAELAEVDAAPEGGAY
jgi:hypothetical protein